ncbi:hypothetical protein RJ640_004574 [Escallonia rubra]|uniref:Reverse transcriptase Ty1/copia-type domain-containing protein n=1 Tax=Escallonia rubra TaxID=112253 RepID=A0AA88UH46_9ASTE|nr:hypothetical protein RJ640_004574 [Escallonia rubra]
MNKIWERKLVVAKKKSKKEKENPSTVICKCEVSARKDRLLEEAMESVTETGLGRVMPLGSGICEAYFDTKNKDSDETEPEDSKKGMKWALPGLQQPPPTAPETQAPRARYNELKQFLVTYGFQKSHLDNSIFILYHFGVVLYLLVFMDDIILIGNNQTALSNVIAVLSHYFSLKDLGYLNYFLGVKVVCRNNGLLLSQSKYIADLLKKYNMHEGKGVTSLMCLTTPLNLHGGSSPTDAEEYRTTISKLQ